MRKLKLQLIDFLIFAVLGRLDNFIFRLKVRAYACRRRIEPDTSKLFEL